MSGMLSDLRYAARALIRNPTFSTVAVATLALGIGVNCAIFGVVNAVLLEPLPYKQPERLAMIWSEMPNRGVTHFPFSPVNLADYRRQSELFEDVAGAATFPQAMSGLEGDPEQITVAAVTWNFLSVLGLQPVIGRDFQPIDAAFNPDEVPDGAQFPANTFLPPNAVILSHELWRRRFGADPGVVGRAVDIGGNPVTVVGVMPPETRLYLPPEAGAAERVDAWAAIRVDMDSAPRLNVFLNVVGRLKPGATLQQARAELAAIDRRIRELETVFETSGYRTRAVPLQRDVVSGVRPALLTLLGAVAFVLLIACVNVANLLLVRAAGRGRELAVRAALGAGRSRLLRQVLLESVLLALTGAVVGVFLALAGMRALMALEPGDLPRLNSVALDPTVLAYAFMLALASGVIAGLVPALRVSRPRIVDRLQDRSAGAGAAGSRRFRVGMVVLEVALSFVLLVGAGLMVRSFIELHRADPGYDPTGVLTFQANPPNSRYPLPEDVAAFNNRLQSRIETLPGVSAVGAVNPLPLSDGRFHSRYATDEAAFTGDNVRQADYRVVQPGYMEAMRTPVLAGRSFIEDDHVNARPYVLVDERLAERTWPGENAIGKALFIRLATPDPVRVEVIGVTRHQRADTLRHDGREAIFMTAGFAGQLAGGVTWTVRAAGDPAALAAAIKEEIAAKDPDVVMTRVRPMTDLVAESAAPTKFALFVVGVFGVIAAVLACVGLYGVLAYLVRQRRGEIGIRMSLGANARRIFALVVGHGMVLAGTGMAIGLALSLLLTRTMSGLLVGVTPTDAATFSGITALFAGVTLLACALPALRAVRVNPSAALRHE